MTNHNNAPATTDTEPVSDQMTRRTFGIRALRFVGAALTTTTLLELAACGEVQPSGECDPSKVEVIQEGLDEFYQALHDSLGANVTQGSGITAQGSLAAVTNLRSGVTTQRTLYTKYTGDAAQQTSGFADPVTASLTEVKGTYVWQHNLWCNMNPQAGPPNQRQVYYEDVELQVAQSDIQIGETVIPAVPIDYVLHGSQVEQLAIYVLPTAPNTPISGVSTDGTKLNNSHSDIVAIVGGVQPGVLPPNATASS